MMMRLLKKILRKTFIYTLYKRRKEKLIEKRKVGEHIFENRSKNSDTLVLVLAGYKEFCKEVVFNRIKNFVPVEYDVCIVSSGLYSKELSKISSNNNWSYISCARNNVCLSVNICIDQFKNAIKIFKIDEDIFVTKNFFKELNKTFEKSKTKNYPYTPSFIAPLIPINGFGNYYVLNNLGGAYLKEYEKRFGAPKIKAGPDTQIENDPEIAKFMWGENDIMPHIDDIDQRFAKLSLGDIACPIRFSIGAILFSRELWQDMRYFIPGEGTGMGEDESQLCKYAMLNSRAIIVSQNTCVGHLSFGKQNKTMKDYFIANKKRFEIKR